MAFEGKKYELYEADRDNFEEYMVELGVGYFTRMVGHRTTPTIFLIKNGDDYEFHTESTFKNTIIKFKLGQEFEEETIDGRNVKSVCTLDGNTLTHKQGGDKPSTIIRVFTPEECVATMTIGNVKCVRKYRAI